MESEREKSASDLASEISGLMKSDRFNPDVQFGKVSPYFSKAMSNIVDYGGKASDLLGTGFNNQLAALEANTGEQIASANLAGGQSRISPFIGAVAPAIANRQSAMANLQENIGSQLANVNLNQGNTLLDIIKSGNQDILSLLGLKSNAIGMENNTTVAGTIAGIAQTLAPIALAIATGGASLPATAGAMAAGSLSGGNSLSSLFGFGSEPFNPQDYSNFRRVLPYNFGE